MISIIICSTRKTISEILKKNIEETVGVEYELIIIDNSSNRYTIFEAYSEGVKLSQGNYLVFMHEDIMFRSTQWGQVLCELLTNKEIGAVGVIGSDIVLPMYFGWWKGGGVGHIIQNFKENKMQHASYPLQASSVSSRDALVLDGLFLGFRKEIFKHIEWDTITYGGFHMYDCDICMQVATKGYKIKVLDILIEHYSLGSVNRMFSEECIKFNPKAQITSRSRVFVSRLCKSLTLSVRLPSVRRHESAESALRTFPCF